MSKYSKSLFGICVCVIFFSSCGKTVGIRTVTNPVVSVGKYAVDIVCKFASYIVKGTSSCVTKVAGGTAKTVSKPFVSAAKGINKKAISPVKNVSKKVVAHSVTPAVRIIKKVAPKVFNFSLMTVKAAAPGVTWVFKKSFKLLKKFFSKKIKNSKPMDNYVTVKVV